MDNDWLIKIREYLLDNKCIFSEQDLLGNISRKKISIKVNHSGKDCVFCITKKEYIEFARNLTTEITVLNYLSKTKQKFIFPKLMNYSLSNLWYIREMMPGDVSGNVYLFSEELLNNTQNILTLVYILKSFKNLQPPVERIFRSNDIIERLHQLINPEFSHNLQIEKLINFIDCKKHDIDNEDFFSFVHRDLQPTNILISNAKLVVFDYEQSGYGNQYLDFASLYHRAAGHTSWQSNFIEHYKKMLAESNTPWDEDIFNIMNLYYLSLDMSSINSAYLSEQKFSFHNTKLDENAARSLMSMYVKEFDQLMNAIRIE